MSYRAVIPFKPVDPKTRLSCVMNREERELFARAMLRDVLTAVWSSGGMPTILSTHSSFSLLNAEVIVTTAGLNDALNSYFTRHKEPLCMVMADLPLVTPDSLLRVVGTRNDIAIVPGRGGGTNVLFLRDPHRFRADFYGASFLKHLHIAAEFGCSVDVVDSFRLHTDVDEKEDLVELLIHGAGTSREFLESLGFSLVTERGRVSVERYTHKEAL